MSSRHRVGTWEWGEPERSPVLSGAEIGRTIAQLARSQTGRAFERVLHACGVGRHRLERIDLDLVVIPDSALTRQATAHANDSYVTPLLHHCYRTFYWAMLLGQYEDARPDPELMFTASILHDIGLSEPHQDESSRTDFAVVGARAAHRFALAQDVDESRARHIYEAISLHLNPVVDARRHGTEAHLLASGAQLDFLGLGRHRIPRDAVQAVHERHPRAGNIGGLLTDIAHPARSRPAVLRPFAAWLSARNPLDRE